MTVRRRLALVAGIVAAIGVALAVRAWRAPPDAFLLSVHPVEDERAVVLLRSNREGRPSRAWIALLDPRRGLRWWTELPGMPVGGGRHGVSVGSNIATVRLEVPERGGATAAFDLEEGRPLWRVPWPRRYGHASLMTLASGGFLVEAIEGGATEGVTIATLERASGRVVVRHALERMDVGSPRTGADWLLVHGSLRAHVMPLSGGSARQLTTGEAGCIEGDELVSLDFRDGAVRVVATALTEPAKPRAVTGLLDVPALAAASWVDSRRCGTFEGRTVFTVEYHRDLGDRSPGIALVSIDRRGDRISWSTDLGTVELGGVLRQDSLDKRFPENAPLVGELTRFVPVPLREKAGGASGGRLVMLDLETGAIVFRGPLSPEFDSYAVFRGDDHHFVSGGPLERGAQDLAVFDGRTGKLLAAAAHTVTEELEPYHVREGRLWLYASAWRDPMPFAVLDAATLRPVVSSGIDVEAASPAFAGMLGQGAAASSTEDPARASPPPP